MVTTSESEPPRWRHDGPGTSTAVWQADPGYAGGGHGGLTLDGVRRLVVVAAHPDDETLGAGGLVATAVRRARVGENLEVSLICATDGEHSHPDSPTTPPTELARRRREELRAAAHAIGVEGAHVELLGHPDGGVEPHVTDLVHHLVGRIGDGRGTVLVAPWRIDGHPDHEAVGRAAAVAARRTGATLWEYPVWFWHWADPSHPAWPELRPWPLDDDARAAKQQAVLAHHTQVAPLSDLSGDEPVLPEPFLAHFTGDTEHFVRTPSQLCEDHVLDDLHRETDDPWGTQTRWYEERKRALVLAALPRRRFRQGLEVGCSTGVLAEDLAERCDALLALDRSTAALERARLRLADRSHVVVEHADVPWEWPPALAARGVCDLVVVSEVGYFLSPVALDGLVERVHDSLRPDGVLVLCHWRHPVNGWVLDAEQVHEAFHRCGLPVQATYQDRDVEIRVHAADATWPNPTQ